METSKAYYESFKAEFLKWQKELGLMQYRIDFFHEKLEDDFAIVTVNELAKTAYVILATEIDDDTDGGAEDHGKHEAIHLLTNRLRYLGGCRYVNGSDLDEEWEAVTRRLEKVFK